jgi:hypothetical protein
VVPAVPAALDLEALRVALPNNTMEARVVPVVLEDLVAPVASRVVLASAVPKAAPEDTRVVTVAPVVTRADLEVTKEATAVLAVLEDLRVEYVYPSQAARALLLTTKIARRLVNNWH